MAGDDSSNSQPSSMPLHLCFFLGTLLFFFIFPWYINHEAPVLDSAYDQLKLVLIASPLLLLLVMRCLPKRDHRRYSHPIPWPKTDSVLGEGGTPWRVGLVLVLVFFMISYQSYFHERWFPFLSKSSKSSS